MTLPVNLPVVAYQGDDFFLSFQIIDKPLGVETPRNLNLPAPAVAVAQVRQQENSTSTVIATMTAVTTGYTDGIVTMTIGKTEMEAITTDQEYWYDVQIDHNGRRFTPIRGTFEVTKDITKVP